MAFKKRESKALELLKTRVDGMAQVEANLDLGNNMSVKELRKKIEAREEALREYNALLTKADMLGNQIDAFELECKEESSNILSGVKSRFGRDSDAVEAVGGKRLSDKKKPT
jgi:hypothetical protein